MSINKYVYNLTPEEQQIADHCDVNITDRIDRLVKMMFKSLRKRSVDDAMVVLKETTGPMPSSFDDAALIAAMVERPGYRNAVARKEAADIKAAEGAAAKASMTLK